MNGKPEATNRQLVLEYESVSRLRQSIVQIETMRGLHTGHEGPTFRALRSAFHIPHRSFQNAGCSSDGQGSGELVT